MGMRAGGRCRLVLGGGPAFPSALIGAILLLVPLMLSSAASAQTADADFAARCHNATPDGLHASADGIILRCFSFDDVSQLPRHVPGSTESWGYDFGINANSNLPQVPGVDTTTKTSGAGSMRFHWPCSASTPCGTSAAGSWFTHFGLNKTHQMGENQAEEIWIQYRVKWSPELFVASNWPGSGGFKVADVSLGDLPSCNPTQPGSYDCPTSCAGQGQTWVTQEQGIDQPAIKNYANCGGNYAYQQMVGVSPGPGGGIPNQNAVDCEYPGFPDPPCVKADASGWFTFKHHIKMGTFNSFTTVLQTWMGRPGQPLKLIIDCSPTATLKCAAPATGAAVNGWWLELQDPNTSAEVHGPWKVGKIYLHPYQTGLSGATTPADVWYDELIISTQDIPDPGGSSSKVAPNVPCCLKLTQLGPMSFVVLGVILVGGRRWHRRGPRWSVGTRPVIDGIGSTRKNGQNPPDRSRDISG